VSESIWSRQFWKNTLELTMYGAATGVGFALPDITHPNWMKIGIYAAAGALAWTAKSIVSNKAGAQKNSPLVTAVAPHGWNPIDPLGDG
jgi:hypothetical protein